MERVLLITDNDLDGVSCDIILNKILGHKYKISTMVKSDESANDAILELISSGRAKDYKFILVTDLIIRKDVVDLIDSVSENIYIIDHHTTSLNISEYDFTSIEVSRDAERQCATSILFRKLKDNISDKALSRCLENYVECVRLYDTWSMDKYDNESNSMSNVALELNILLGKLGYDVFKKHMSDQFMTNNYDPKMTSFFMRDLIASDLNFFDTLIDESTSKMKIIKLKSGLKMGVTSIHHFMYGYILNAICDNNKDIDLICTLNTDRIALRTRKDINLLELSSDFNNRKIIGQPTNAKIMIEEDFWLDLFSI